MTLEERIEQEKFKARVDRIKTNKRIFHNNDEDEIEACILRAEEHEQLAEWLEELKKRRSEDYGYMADIHQSIGYRKALDDFVKAIVDRGLSANDDKYCITHYDNYLKVIKEIAEQLKAGGAE